MRILQLVRAIEILVLVFTAFGCFQFWRKTRFWLPLYIHVFAAVGFIVMLAALAMAPPDAPLHKWGPLSRALFSLALPAIVYAFFIVHGGQHAAFRRMKEKQTPCPGCGKPLAAFKQESSETASVGEFLNRHCVHCGHPL